jgi:hypothetical protein
MGQAIYTIADIIIEPYEFNRILDFKIEREFNEHAMLYIEGIVPEEKIDRYVENSSENEIIKVSLKGETKNVVLFYGVVTYMSLHAKMDVRSIRVEALSLSFLMDIKKKKRSFQNKDTAYKEIFERVTDEYTNSQALDETTKGKTTGGLLVQYLETDWEFVKRLATHFNAPIIPSCTIEGVKYHIGITEIHSGHDLKEYNYIIKKDIQDYLRKSQNGIDGTEEKSLISYVITCPDILEPGRQIGFKNRKLYIISAVTKVENGIVVNTYTLKDRDRIKYNRIYNDLLTGVSLFGNVIDVAKDTVKVHLQIDEKQSVDQAMWFPYSTVYSSPDGSGW